MAFVSLGNLGEQIATGYDFFVGSASHVTLITILDTRMINIIHSSSYVSLELHIFPYVATTMTKYDTFLESE